MKNKKENLKAKELTEEEKQKIKEHFSQLGKKSWEVRKNKIIEKLKTN